MRRSTGLLLIIGMSACGTRQAPAPMRMPDAGRPNIVVVIVDDLRFDEFHAGGHPYLETPNIDRLASEGALFVNAFHAVPLCSPNRATLLTGQYPSRHGIIDNVARDLASHHLQTFNIPLQQAGYRTAFLGKWHMGNDPTPLQLPPSSESQFPLSRNPSRASLVTPKTPQWSATPSRQPSRGRMATSSIRIWATHLTVT